MSEPEVLRSEPEVVLWSCAICGHLTSAVTPDRMIDMAIDHAVFSHLDKPWVPSDILKIRRAIVQKYREDSL